MSLQLAVVKGHIVHKEWVLAKKLLLQMHLKNRQNTTILCKLGDCCLKLNEYDLAKQCYIRCINYDKYYFGTENPKHLLKLAHIYQIYYDPDCSQNDSEQLCESQLLFEKVIAFIDSSDKISNKLIRKCYFYYAQLLTKLKQYSLAQKYYEKLISFNIKHKFNHHSIYYYYGKLLFLSCTKYTHDKKDLIFFWGDKSVRILNVFMV